MKKFRSKSDFLFGIIIFSAVALLNIPAIIRLIKYRELAPLTIISLTVIFVFSFVMFVLGMQKINFNQNGIVLEIFKIPVKEIKWKDAREIGIGKIKLSKNQYMKQLYVSKRNLLKQEYEELSKIKFTTDVIWFDYDEDSENKLIECMKKYKK